MSLNTTKATLLGLLACVALCATGCNPDGTCIMTKRADKIQPGEVDTDSCRIDSNKWSCTDNNVDLAQFTKEDQVSGTLHCKLAGFDHKQSETSYYHSRSYRSAAK